MGLANHSQGLDTVVPVAGPSSWYDHRNRQGICAILIMVITIAAFTVTLSARRQ